MYCLNHSTAFPSPSLLCLPSSTPFNSSSLLNKRNNQLGWAFSLRCNAISKPTTNDYRELLQDELPLLKHQLDIVDDDVKSLAIKVYTTSGIKENVEKIREILKCMNDGDISISPYDTAWVALVKDNNGNPLFPSSLQWIIDNQHLDGSWGDHLIFSPHDRIINTLACIIALKSWNVYLDKCQKGILFLKENINKLQEESMEHMPIGFEVAFPSLIELAQSYGIEVAQHSPAMQQIYAKRDLKLTRIPKEIMHRMPTTLLHSLEGMDGLDWEKLLKLQSKDGSFLFSPSSTAYALMQTKDLNCFNYLNNIVQRFNGGAPNVYPIDLFEHIWVVDRLERLGISRYFTHEIDECLSYVKRYWTERGICWARNSDVQDIDDTAMAFRLLRLHGYQVSADVFKNFEKEGKFFAFYGQSTQAVSGMYNLFRASQLQYPGETILEKARLFSYNYLKEKQLSNQLLDKWSIAKDLQGEVTYALDIPWYASLPRLETRFYIQQYGGENDVWIGKTLYRIPNVSNNAYLELAKLDYNNIQALHKQEWNNLLRWYLDYNLRELGVSQRSLLVTYFVASSTIFEPEKSNKRLAWAKTAALIQAIDFEYSSNLFEEKNCFLTQFQHSYISQGYLNNGGRKLVSVKKGQILVGLILSTIDELSMDALVTHETNIRNQLFQAWENWLKRWEREDRNEGEVGFLIQIIELCANRWMFENMASNYNDNKSILSLLNMTSRLCHNLVHHQRDNNKVDCVRISGGGYTDIKAVELEMDMQKLTELILSSSINHNLKETCLALVKAYFYINHCSSQQIDYHIHKVLFQKID
ncbi:unnamed protein product [Amaranthus hypochondriacus]